MERFDTRIDDGYLYIETPEGELEVGAMDDVVELLGETYTLEYDDEARAAAWLNTEPDGTITFDVRETLAGMDFDEAFVKRVAGWSTAETPDGYPRRTEQFAELMAEIWDAKGNVEID